MTLSLEQAESVRGLHTESEEIKATLKRIGEALGDTKPRPKLEPIAGKAKRQTKPRGRLKSVGS